MNITLTTHTALLATSFTKWRDAYQLEVTMNWNQRRYAETRLFDGKWEILF